MIYDDANRTLTQVRLDYDGANYVTFKTAMEYDGANRATRTINQGPDGDITTAADNLASTRWYDANGQVTQTQDPAGMQVVMAYDAFGQTTRQSEASETGGIGRITDRVYDRAGRLTRLTAYTDSSSASGGGGTGVQHTDYLYNKAGVITRATYPDDAVGDRGYVEFAFDGALRLTRQTDQKGLATDTVYDDMGRRLTVTRGSQVDSYTYTDWGALASAKRGTAANPDATSETTRLYDGLNRMTAETQEIEEDASPRTVSYDYDLAGNVLTLGYPGGTTIATSYDAGNRADILKKDASQIADYDYIGSRPQQVIFETGANDITQSHEYDGVAPDAFGPEPQRHGTGHLRLQLRCRLQHHDQDLRAPEFRGRGAERGLRLRQPAPADEHRVRPASKHAV